MWWAGLMSEVPTANVAITYRLRFTSGIMGPKMQAHLPAVAHILLTVRCSVLPGWARLHLLMPLQKVAQLVAGQLVPLDLICTNSAGTVMISGQSAVCPVSCSVGGVVQCVTFALHLIIANAAGRAGLMGRSGSAAAQADLWG